MSNYAFPLVHYYDCYRKDIQQSKTFAWLWKEGVNEDVKMCIYNEQPTENDSVEGCIYMPQMPSAPVLAHELAHAQSALAMENRKHYIDDEKRSYSFQRIVRVELESRGYKFPDNEMELETEEIEEVYNEHYEDISE